MTKGILEKLVKPGETVILPGVFNALTARIAARAGFDTVFLSGAGISNNFLAVPDLGFLNFEQLKSHVEQIILSSDVSVIVDYDSGYGDAKSAVRQAKLLERMGVSGVVIEDKFQQKRCGCSKANPLIDITTMSCKIQAIRDACNNLLIIGRTGAVCEAGIDEVVHRIHCYHEAGADITYVEAPANLEHIRAITAMPWPQAVNIVEGGPTPLMSFYELNKLGFAFAIYSNFASRMAMKVMQIAYRTLFTQKDTQLLIDEMITWDEREQLVGIDEWVRFEQMYIR